MATRHDGNSPAAVTNSAAFLKRKQLLGPETLVVHLARRLDKVLKMRLGQEVAKVDEFAVVLVLDVDNTPSVLATADSTAAVSYTHLTLPTKRIV